MGKSKKQKKTLRAQKASGKLFSFDRSLPSPSLKKLTTAIFFGVASYCSITFLPPAPPPPSQIDVMEKKLLSMEGEELQSPIPSSFVYPR